MLTAIRLQAQRVLYAVKAMRKPALRRADVPHALLTTDLPLIADADAVEAFCRELTGLGWTVGEHHGWLTLDAPVPSPEYSVPADLAGQCGCCISLLLRHPDNAPAEDCIRAVVKAADAGRMPFDRLCSQLHGELAAKLRRHELLPGALLPYLCHAYQKFYR